MSMQVYLVSAYVSRESETVVACFALERDAKAFAKRCKEYDAKEPKCPNLNDSDEIWDKYNRREVNWRKRHPAKVYSPPDDYIVSSIKVRPTVMSKPVD
jgi:hypothetical protein